MEVIKKILSAGLKAPTNNHLRQWEFVIINDKKERLRVLKLEDMTNPDDCDKMLDGFGMTDTDQRGMYHIAMPKQFSMLYNSGCLILPFFKLREPLLQPTCLSSLNEFASIWLCIENILLAAAAEGIFGVTRIPMTEELEHIKKQSIILTIMRCLVTLLWDILPKMQKYRCKKLLMLKTGYISIIGKIGSETMRRASPIQRSFLQSAGLLYGMRLPAGLNVRL